MEIWKKYQALLQRYGFNLLMVLAFWGGMIRKSFNCDTLSHEFVEGADIMVRIIGGRYVVALIDFLLLKLWNIRTTTNISVTMIITFLILAIVMMEIQNIFVRWLPDTWWGKIVFFCGLNLMFLNVLFAEPLMFGEYSVYYAIAYFTAAVGVKCFAGHKFFSMLIMYAIAVFTYQNAVIFAAVITAFYVFLDEDMRLSQKAVVREIAGVSVCMGMGVLNYLCLWILDRMGIVSSSKEAVTGNLGRRIGEAVNHFINLNRNCGGIMPDIWLPLLFTAVIWVLVVYSCIKEQKLSELLFMLLVWLGCNMVLYVIPVVQGTPPPPRLIFCFFGVQGFLLVSAYVVCQDSLRGILVWGGCLYLTAHLLFSNFIVTNHFVSNTLDKVYAKMVYDKILEYEDETGNYVTKLAVVRDINASFYYDDVSYKLDQINERTYGYAPFSLMYAVTGRRFEAAEMPKSITQKYFYKKNWDYIDLNEQLVIEGDTAYWCIF